MKKPRSLLLLFLALFNVCTFSYFCTSAFAVPKEQPSVFVQVKSSKIRTEPKPWSAGIENVNFGAALQVVDASAAGPGGWVKVKGPGGKIGFVPVSAVSTKKLALKSAKGAASGGADSSDEVLAGKGFSPENEKLFASSNAQANFGAVNQLEKMRVGDADLLGFMKAGKLNS